MLRIGGRLGIVGTIVAAVVLLAGAAAARADVGDAYLDACLNAGTAQAPCASGPGLSGAFPQALSPDGRQLYVGVAGGTPPGGSAEETAVLIFDRDPATGILTRRQSLGCVTPSGSSGACVAAPQLGNPQDILVSPDGRNVYVSNAGTSSIVEFDRSASGALSLGAQCQGAAAPCVVANGMMTPYALGISPDGATLYARTGNNSGQGTLLVFRRSGDGTLTQLSGSDGCWSELATTGCHTAAGISDQGWQIAVTASNVYVTGRNDAYFYITSGCGAFCVNNVPASGSVAIFGHNADGSLTQAAEPNGCISNNGTSGGIPFSAPAPVRCLDGDDTLEEARGVTASADGKSVYVGADPGLVAFSRGAGGALTDIGCLRPGGAGGCADAPVVGNVFRMALTAAGDELVAASFSGALDFLDRNPATGALSQRPGASGCVSSDGTGGKCQVLPALGGFGGVSVSSDSTFVYATGSTHGLLATFHRDRAPSCQARTVAVPYQMSVPVPLTCADPDGDALSLEITHQPTAGALAGAIDMGNDTVRYNPPLAFTGTDSFEYAATGRGVRSAPARVTLDVRPAVAAEPVRPALKPLHVRVKAGWAVHGSRFTLNSLRLSKLPVGWGATLRCGGHHCPFKTKQVKRRGAKSGSVDAVRSLSKRQRHFRAGQKLTVEVRAPGYASEQVLYKLRKGKKPKGVVRP